MTGLMDSDESLRHELFNKPYYFNNRYDNDADCEIRRVLFRSLARDTSDYLRLLFPQGVPSDQSIPWKIKEAQGAIDGAEYTAGAKGTPCGHIFKSGESTYHCKTCAADDTCVLCARCFESSDHEGHTVFISVSPGNSGCCDCGDHEAWRREMRCSIHSEDAQEELKQSGKEKEKGPATSVGSTLPVGLVESIRMTIGRCVDYLCDVFSCSPEQLRLPKTEEGILQDERLSRLSAWYGGAPEPECKEYCLVLWNDEKHTVDDVQNQVARACSQRKKFGYEKAMEVNDVGRSIIQYGTDLQDLLRMSSIIEQLKVTVTIRSSRDTFREQMCATIIDWLADISGASVGDDPYLLRNIVCEEFLKGWRLGSEGTNRDIGQSGIDDHEYEENMNMRKRYRTFVQGFAAANVIRVEIEGEADDNDEDEDDDLDDGYDDDEDMDGEEMEIEFGDLHSAATAALAHREQGDMDVDFVEGEEDVTETLEAAIAGYPPPPPPPPPPQRRRLFTPAESEDGEANAETARHQAKTPFGDIPKTPKVKERRRPLRPGRHWLEKPDGVKTSRPSDPAEDLRQQVRLDYLILYDLRLWKTLRIQLRHLYITTVVTIPHFKRILGLRFAGLYTHLAQLYLIADREPDHSIINLSVQMLTTPTITQEVVDRGNFLTNLMAILYTFLTTRQVGFPEDVSPKATLAFDVGAVTNRRMFHFFLDLRWLFQSEFIHYRMRVEPRYLLQFLDLAKLHQGICPNVRALGEHVEYESDAWISASMITKEMNKLCKQVAVSFEPQRMVEDGNLQRAIRNVAQVTMINSFGYERHRFQQAELKEDLTFHTIGPFVAQGVTYQVPKYTVQSDPMSFHHPLHYLLSWLIEDGSHILDRAELKALLTFTPDDLKDPFSERSRAQPKYVQTLSAGELMGGIFDMPIRLCAWLAQMKAGMWVRNGITLRHQAATYRSVSHRDVGYQRDLLMVQANLVLGGSDERPGEYALAQMVDRFQIGSWVKGDHSVVPGFEESQQLDCIEDFFHLLVVALSERRNLVLGIDSKDKSDKILQHDIAHALCFKPLSFSDLSLKVTEKVAESDDFGRVLEGMTNYQPPEGLSDTGTFKLKPEYIELVDPYYAHYSRNQREEAESVYKTYIARKTGQKVEDVVFEPTLDRVEKGLFVHLADFTTTPLFAQIISSALRYADQPNPDTKLQATRIETFLHMVSHLIVIAVNESSSNGGAFVRLAAEGHGDVSTTSTIFQLLVKLSSNDEYASCHPTISHILKKMQRSQPDRLASSMGPLSHVFNRSDTGSPASLSADEKDRKKQEALARQARIMAQMKQQQNSFLQNQGLSSFDDNFEDVDDEMSMAGENDEGGTRKKWSFPTGTCILCQEETDDSRLFGTFAFLGESNTLRSTPMEEPVGDQYGQVRDFVQEVLDVPESLDRSAEERRPFGIAGKNKQTVVKQGPNGPVSRDVRVLSKGFPVEQASKQGPVATSCGHIMHFSCFELYLTATLRRHAQQIARSHPENTQHKEFVCPLCKALGNTFMPIIWKHKECTPEYELHAARPFSDWLDKCRNQYAPDLSFLDEDASESHRQASESQFTERAHQHVNGMFAPSLVSSMADLSLTNQNRRVTVAAESQYRGGRGLSFSGISDLFRRNTPSTGSTELPPNVLASSPTESQSRTGDLLRAYDRIDSAIKANGLHKYNRNQQVDSLSSAFSPLSRTLGYTITSLEIAHRGTNHDPLATSLITDIPEQAVVHLRILSETIESYLAVNALQNRSTLIAEASKRQDAMAAALFCVDSPETQVHLSEWTGGHFFAKDTFLFFSDWLALMSPKVDEAVSVLQLCCWAEIVKSIYVHKKSITDPSILPHLSLQGSTSANEHLASVVQEIWSQTEVFDGVEATVNEHNLALVSRLAEKYALTFLRKGMILIYIRYGLDFECPYNVDPDTPELERLTKLLHIHSIPELCQIFTSRASPGSRNLRDMTAHWINQAGEQETLGDLDDLKPMVPHPAIFELIGLPGTYDALTEEAIKRRCPTTGREITDPAVCLFCGAIFCSQALCCMKNRTQGGCFQHMGRCGGKIGIFITIRKCMVLFTHGPGNGSYAHAPYLDKHGEPDPTLRRHHQLFLNQKRYDRLLREAWLGHGVPSVISRKLESDNNPGGWETL
ncbi:hypothetical protein K431DRAFT_282091 [Polychaeton citri CBS 116435]|uniref:E3 ubiquitin-protein ligase n=1 Tax=Polychaeton citri CBS 116435 TaxID=1314669 RepID=A0A9P4URS8_9PEZI|nr:hypothetical protein K431DRAFT_282091 [Polychaeton citri CBS 116435]